MRFERRLKRAIPVDLRNRIKSAICRALCRHTQVIGEDIFLHVSRRSGSTWLTEIISSELDIRCVQDPLTQRNVHSRYRSLLGGEEHRYFCRLDPNLAGPLSEYFNRILAGDLNVGTQWNPFSTQFHRRTSRTIIKLCNAGGLAEWLSGEFQGKTVVMIRHPIPTCMSQMQWGLTPYTKAFRDDDWFFQTVLSREQQELVNRVIESGDQMAAHVTDWCLENLIPLTRLSQTESLIVTYEELSTNPAEVLTTLAKYCSLKSIDRITSQYLKPSVTQSEEAVQNGISSTHWTRWMKRIDSTVSQRLMQICDTFGITAYSATSGLPTQFWVGPRPLTQ